MVDWYSYGNRYNLVAVSHSFMGDMVSKKLLIRLESNNKQYPPITLEIAIPDDVANIIQNTPITSTTFTITDSIFLTKPAQDEELKTGETNRFNIGG